MQTITSNLTPTSSAQRQATRNIPTNLFATLTSNKTNLQVGENFILTVQLSQPISGVRCNVKRLSSTCGQVNQTPEISAYSDLQGNASLVLNAQNTTTIFCQTQYIADIQVGTRVIQTNSVLITTQGNPQGTTAPPSSLLTSNTPVTPALSNTAIDRYQAQPADQTLGPGGQLQNNLDSLKTVSGGAVGQEMTQMASNLQSMFGDVMDLLNMFGVNAPTERTAHTSRHHHQFVQGSTTSTMSRFTGFSSGTLANVVKGEKPDVKPVEEAVQGTKADVKKYVDEFKKQVEKSGRHTADVAAAVSTRFPSAEQLTTSNELIQKSCSQFRVVASGVYDINAASIVQATQQQVCLSRFEHHVSDMYQGAHQNLWVRSENMHMTMGEIIVRYGPTVDLARTYERIAGPSYIYADDITVQVGFSDKVNGGSTSLQPGLPDGILGEGGSLGSISGLDGVLSGGLGSIGGGAGFLNQGGQSGTAKLVYVIEDEKLVYVDKGKYQLRAKGIALLSEMDKLDIFGQQGVNIGADLGDIQIKARLNSKLESEVSTSVKAGVVLSLNAPLVMIGMNGIEAASLTPPVITKPETKNHKAQDQPNKYPKGIVLETTKREAKGGRAPKPILPEQGEDKFTRSAPDPASYTNGYTAD